MADDEGPDYSTAISPEIWFMVFQQLRDPCTLATVGEVCRRFYELSGDDSLWKALSLRVYSPTARKQLRKTTGWKQFFEGLSVFQVGPKWSVYTKLDSPFSFEARSISIEFDSSPMSMSPTMRRRSRRYTSCEALTGQGQAPFGVFDAIACNYGAYYAVALLISDERFTCFLNRADGDKSVMSGPFHSRWSNVCGVSVWQAYSDSESLSRPDKNAQLAEHIEALSAVRSASPDRGLLGDFVVTLAFDQEGPREHVVTFRLGETLIGSIVDQDILPELASSSVVGTTDGDVLALGVLLVGSRPELSAQIVSACELTRDECRPDEVTLRGTFVVKEGPSVSTGILSGRRTRAAAPRSP